MTVMRDQVVTGVRGGQTGRESGPQAGHAAVLQLATQQRQSALTSAIEMLVIPRLVRAHRATAPSGFATAVRSGVLGAESVRAFAQLMLDGAMPTAAAYLAAMRNGGTSVESLYLDLLAPAARHLGELWEEDVCDFSQVTLGLSRLHQVLHTVSDASGSAAASLDPGRHVLLVPAPGDQHSFGLVMVAEFFRRAGWSVWSGTPATLGELLAMVRTEWFALIGFSTACSSRLEMLASGIRQVRGASRNRDIGVMVGGPLFVASPELVAQVGADATASDGRGAVGEASLLLARQVTRARSRRAHAAPMLMPM